VILFEFKPTHVELSVDALGGAIKINLKYDKYPDLANLPAAQLEALGLALSVAVATSEAQVAQIALQATTEYVKQVRQAGLILPPEGLVLPE
jgi:hypothetical protein